MLNKKNKKKIFVMKILLLIFFVSIGLAGAGMIYLNYLILNLNESNLKSSEKNITLKTENDFLIDDKMVLNVLVLGIDTLATKFNGRSDSVMIFSLDLRSKKIKITSLMRDIWCLINNSYDRLNAAYPLGGALLTCNTIEKNFGIKMDRYISIDFKGFEKIIDSIDGVEIDVTPNEVNFINKNSTGKKIEGSGKLTLNGNQALQYSRNRDSAGSDYDRTKRQRKMFKASIRKIRKLNAKKIGSLSLNLIKYVKTDFKISEVINFVNKAEKFLDFDIDTFRLPTDDNVKDAVIDGKMVLTIPDFKKAKEDISNFILKNETGISE